MQTEKKFPEGFYWGAATASYQVEGGIENCDWAKAAREGKVPVCGRACDHYNKYESDFDIAKSLGHNAHRFSLEWARIEPEEGKFDENEIEHYRNIIQALRNRGIRPYTTLWHFTLPLWFSESGGFERKDSPEIFARYAKYVAEKLGDTLEGISTMNEPNVFATHGWLYAEWPPFKRARILWKKLGSKRSKDTSFLNVYKYFKVTNNLAKAHSLAFVAIKDANSKITVSVVKQVHAYDSNKNPTNIVKAYLSNRFQNHRFMKKIQNHLDEIGMNYYHYTKYGDDRVHIKTDMGWDALPEHLYDALMDLKRYQKPVFVSEAGVADSDDDMRASYIIKQVEATWKALQDGVDVRGHIYWSLLDNYEWAFGFKKRFGLVEIDYDTLERKIRPSAYVYKKIIEDNGIVE